MGKIWKKLLFIILVIACLFNIVTKLVKRNSFKNEIQATVQYFYDKQNEAVVENEQNSELQNN